MAELLPNDPDSIRIGYRSYPHKGRKEVRKERKKERKKERRKRWEKW